MSLGKRTYDFTAMFIFFLLSVLSLSSGAPITSNIYDDVSPLVFLGRELSECLNPARYRTLQGIIWSCLATIIACTWGAVHPNLEGPMDSWWTKSRRQVLTMVYAMIAPEAITLWAMRQRIAAGRIAKQFNQRGWGQAKWTVTHGFFVQMGGFILFQDGTPIAVLTFDDLVVMIENGRVDAPAIAEHEINDRSKGEFLTKLLVVLQTTWFLLQCLARWASDLPVTELEVVTLAFSVLNIFTYALWWNKPQNVHVAISVHLKQQSYNDGRTGGDREVDRLLGDGKQEKEQNWVTRKVGEAMDEGCCGCIFEVPYRLFLGLLRPLVKLAGDDNSDVRRKSLRMPMFYADEKDDGTGYTQLIVFLLISAMFGGIHLIPWSSSFPTTTERNLWRFSAVFITLIPVLGPMTLAASKSRTRNWLSTVFFWLTVIPSAIGLPLYIFARFAILVIAFSTLRALPLGAYITPEWTTFVPHI